MKNIFYRKRKNNKMKEWLKTHSIGKFLLVNLTLIIGAIILLGAIIWEAIIILGE